MTREQQFKELPRGRKTWVTKPRCKAIYRLYPARYTQKRFLGAETRAGCLPGTGFSPQLPTTSIMISCNWLARWMASDSCLREVRVNHLIRLTDLISRGLHKNLKAPLFLPKEYPSHMYPKGLLTTTTNKSSQTRTQITSAIDSLEVLNSFSINIQQ